MHAASFSETWHQWRDSVSHAFEPHPPHFEAESHRLNDNPMRARLKPIHLLPLAIPGMAVLLAVCAVLIGSLLRG